MSDESSNTVVVDEDLKDLIPSFLEKRKADFVLLRELIEKKDFGQVKGIGHRMKGTAGSYGFDEITRLSKELEDAALNADSAQSIAIVVKMEAYMQNAKIVYQSP